MQAEKKRREGAEVKKAKGYSTLFHFANKFDGFLVRTDLDDRAREEEDTIVSLELDIRDEGPRAPRPNQHPSRWAVPVSSGYPLNVTVVSGNTFELVRDDDVALCGC